MEAGAVLAAAVLIAAVLPAADLSAPPVGEVLVGAADGAAAAPVTALLTTGPLLPTAGITTMITGITEVRQEGVSLRWSLC